MYFIFIFLKLSYARYQCIIIASKYIFIHLLTFPNQINALKLD